MNVQYRMLLNLYLPPQCEHSAVVALLGLQRRFNSLSVTFMAE